MRTRPNKNLPTPSGKPKFPEIGNFKVFWNIFKTLQSTGQHEDANFVVSKLAEMCNLRDSDHSSCVLLQIGEKIDKFLCSTAEAEKKAAEIVIEVLNMQCSIRSHPFWDIKSDKDMADKLYFELQDQKRFIMRTTRSWLSWFRDGTLLTDDGSIPEDRLTAIEKCKEIFAENAGSDWQTRKRPSFEGWLKFLRPKDGVDYMNLDRKDASC